MSENPRARKLADRIKVIIAQRLERGLRDPRMGFVTITDVNVTGDLQHASIFYTVYGSDQEREDSHQALLSAMGMLRTEVGKNITSRLVPTLEFIPDGLFESATHIEDLLAQAQEHDKQVSVLAQEASYAGDEDPYVKRESVEDDLTQDDSGQL